MRAISITRAIGRGGLEIETFLSHEMATSKESAISAAIVPKKSGLSKVLAWTRAFKAMKNLVRATNSSNFWDKTTGWIQFCFRARVFRKKLEGGRGESWGGFVTVCVSERRHCLLCLYHSQIVFLALKMRRSHVLYLTSILFGLRIRAVSFTSPVPRFNTLWMRIPAVSSTCPVTCFNTLWIDDKSGVLHFSGQSLSRASPQSNCVSSP